MSSIEALILTENKKQLRSKWVDGFGSIDYFFMREFFQFMFLYFSIISDSYKKIHESVSEAFWIGGTSFLNNPLSQKQLLND